MRVTVETQDGAAIATAPLGQFLPDGNVEAGTALIRATIPNRSGTLRPGMALRGRVMVNPRSEEHTSELQSLMRISYAVFCLKKKKHTEPRQRSPLSYQQS